MVCSDDPTNLVLHESNQISIEGNQFLSAGAAVVLPLSYPQSLLQIQPEAMRYLESQATIAEATVTRQLFLQV